MGCLGWRRCGGGGGEALPGQRPGGWDVLADMLANDGRIVLGIVPEPQLEPEEVSGEEAVTEPEPDISEEPREQ